MATLDHFTELVLSLRDNMDITTLVETGTFRGDSTHWAAPHFDHVITIEIRQDFFRAAQENTQANNIVFILGDSRVVLPDIVARLHGPAIFWLDAHNEAGLFGPGPNDCPLLEELFAIVKSPHRHAILVDDAHCFDGTHAGFPHIRDVKSTAAPYILQRTDDILIFLHPEDVHEAYGITDK